MFYFDPTDADPLKAAQATLPVEAQRRIFAFKYAVQVFGTAGWACGATLEDATAKVFEIADFVESGLLEKEREERTIKLVAMPYPKYLRTPEWQAKRAEARERAGGRCQVCNGHGPLDVHHRTYERRGNERDSDLTVICRECHELFSSNGRLQG